MNARAPAVNPLIAASILVYCEDGWAGWPATMALAYGIMRLLGASLPEPRIPILMGPGLLRRVLRRRRG